MTVIDFLFDANKSGQFQPVRKVASGGELSRLMLCIKSLVAQSIDLPTMIFDEIDTGISGEAAKQVGIILKELAVKRQVICITHQPQIAGKADAHFFVYKEIVKDMVKTNIRRLTNEERITAIAKMLSGEKPTAAALENAKGDGGELKNMSPVYKLALFIIILGLLLVSGYSSFRYLNRKIKESETGWELAGYSLLLVLVNVGLLVGGLFLLIKSYGYLADVE